ncbi:protein of unknown function (plasmid) [Cupriavidus taiwanensis]|uniref:Uncharacterized protein n=1 Tax=Cupriavidus taiwanensis TaxID=164546 RepID=A0A375IRC7_9BURK|nr:protein of unknown function [Cupriavidus taiwanensis]
MQFCIGVLAEVDVIKRPIKNYVPFISDELLSLYPKARVLGVGFDLELTPSD